MRGLWVLALAGVFAAAAGAPPIVIREDPPVASAPKPGRVTGTIAPAGAVAKLYAVSRATGKRYGPSAFDRKSGRFAFKNMPGDAAYDVGVITHDGRRIEGIDLSWHEARWLRLAAIRRKQLKVPPAQTHRFSRADAVELLKYVRDLKDFTDVRRALYLRGEGVHATMLVEVMRVRDFYARRGEELIWRTELWYFKYQHGGWERVANVERVLERHRIPAAKWQAITLVYYPALTAWVDEAGRSKPIKFTIPRDLDRARGRLADTEPAQETQPILLGLPEPKTRPATAPATQATTRQSSK